MPKVFELVQYVWAGTQPSPLPGQGSCSTSSLNLPVGCSCHSQSNYQVPAMGQDRISFNSNKWLGFLIPTKQMRKQHLQN